MGSGMCSPRWEQLGVDVLPAAVGVLLLVAVVAELGEDVLPAAVGVLLLVAVVAELGEDVLPVAVGVLLLVALLLAGVIVLRRSLAGTILFISGCGGQHKLGSVISTPSATGSLHSLVLRHRLSTTTDMLLFVLMIFS